MISIQGMEEPHPPRMLYHGFTIIKLLKWSTKFMNHLEEEEKYYLLLKTILLQN